MVTLVKLVPLKFSIYLEMSRSVHLKLILNSILCYIYAYVE